LNGLGHEPLARQTEVDIGITGAKDRFAGMLEIFVDDAQTRGDTEHPGPDRGTEIGGIEQPLQRHHGAGAVGADGDLRLAAAVGEQQLVQREGRRRTGSDRQRRGLQCAG
jgi:hypothetical protein